MDGHDTTQSLLVLRKLTRAIGDAIKGQMTDYLATLAPLMEPRSVLGDYIEGGTKSSVKRADKAFKELKELHELLAATKPYALQRELTPPLRYTGNGLEITPVDYLHRIDTDGGSRTIKVRSPLSWTLTYSGYSLSRLPELLKAQIRAGDDLNHIVLATLLLHVLVHNSPGLMQVFDALHFPITSVTIPEFGPLPVTRIGAAVTTVRPSDAVILEMAELTGMDAFEEVVDVSQIGNLRDPLKERLVELIRQHAPSLL